MTDVTCGEVRRYLETLSSGSPEPNQPTARTALENHGAIDGPPGSTRITPIGQYVLNELKLRSYRLDPFPLEVASAQIARVQTDLDLVAKTAEYFMADLGPVTPPEAVPLLRPVAVGLASRRETPEELAEEFRNAWGSVEVMGGDSRDRLLAAELLNAADLPLGTVYAPMNVTVQRLREEEGTRSPAVSVASILHLMTPEGATIPLEAYRSFRKRTPTFEAAALLASKFFDRPEDALRVRDQVLSQLAPGANEADPDAGSAAVYVAAMGNGNNSTLSRAREIAKGLTSSFDRPLLPATVLAEHAHLSPEEILAWFATAEKAVTDHHLAPTHKEVSALAVGIVHGIPASHFTLGEGPQSATPRSPIPALLALHRWIYRPLLAATDPSSAARATAYG